MSGIAEQYRILRARSARRSNKLDCSAPTSPGINPTRRRVMRSPLHATLLRTKRRHALNLKPTNCQGGGVRRNMCVPLCTCIMTSVDRRRRPVQYGKFKRRSLMSHRPRGCGHSTRKSCVLLLHAVPKISTPVNPRSLLGAQQQPPLSHHFFSTTGLLPLSICHDGQVILIRSPPTDSY